MNSLYRAQFAWASGAMFGLGVAAIGGLRSYGWDEAALPFGMSLVCAAFAWYISRQDRGHD